MTTEVKYTDEKSEFRDEVISKVAKHQQLIHKNREYIDEIFKDFLRKDHSYSNLDPLFNGIESIFAGELEEETRQDLSEAMINLVAIANSTVLEELKEELSEDYESDILSFISVLNSKYSDELIGVMNHLKQGSDWWSNVDTTPGIRRDSVSFEHEITIRGEERFSFNSDMQSTASLTRHLLSHLVDVPSLLGEDSLSELSTGHVERIRELAEELEEMKNEYEDMDLTEGEESEETQSGENIE